MLGAISLMVKQPSVLISEGATANALYSKRADDCKYQDNHTELESASSLRSQQCGFTQKHGAAFAEFHCDALRASGGGSRVNAKSAANVFEEFFANQLAAHLCQTLSRQH